MQVHPKRKNFKAEYCRVIYKLALLGLSDERICLYFGISDKLFRSWQRRHPEFKQAMLDGKLLADGDVAKGMYERAKGYKHPEDKIFLVDGEPLVVPTIKHYPPDTSAAIFWLKNRSEIWSDTSVQEVSVEETSRLVFAAPEDDAPADDADNTPDT